MQSNGSATKNTTPRGILKKLSSPVNAVVGNTDCRKETDGIIVANYVSPFSTPSAGILKRRRHLFEESTDDLEKELRPLATTPSKRRVHFSTTDITCLSASEDEEEYPRSTVRKKARLRTNSPSASFANSFQTRTIRMVQRAKKTLGETGISLLLDADPPSESSTELPSESGTDPPSEISNSFQTSTGIDSGANEPIYPSLASCIHPIESLISQLSPTSCYRGLAMFLKGRNIGTIGQLAAMSESQIQLLPVKQPKVEIVRNVLQLVERDYTVKNGAAAIEAISKCNSETIDPVASSDRQIGIDDSDGPSLSDVSDPMLNLSESGASADLEQVNNSEGKAQLDVDDCSTPVPINGDSGSTPVPINGDSDPTPMPINGESGSPTGQLDGHSNETNPFIPTSTADIGCQVDDSTSLTHLSLAELRSVSLHLMSSLKAVFDRIRQLE